MAEPIAQVSVSALRAAALQELNAQAKTKSALTIHVMTATQRMAVPIASVSVLAEPTPLLCSRFVPRRNLHPVADSQEKNAHERTKSVSMTHETVAIRRMAGPIAQESALVLHVEDLRVRNAKPERRVSTIREIAVILTRAGLIASECVSSGDSDKIRFLKGLWTGRC